MQINTEELDKIKKKLQEQLIKSISQETYGTEDEIYEIIELYTLFTRYCFSSAVI